MGCLKHSDPNISERMIFQYPTNDAAYDIELLGDTLYVANGTDGMRILKVNQESQLSLEPIFEGNVASQDERFVDIVATDKFIFLLEKLIFQNASVYVLPNDYPINTGRLYKSNDITYVSKLVFEGQYTDETGGEVFGLVFLKKVLNPYNKFRRSAFVYKSSFLNYYELILEDEDDPVILSRKMMVLYF